MKEGLWLNEPAAWNWVDDELHLVTDPRTDFWRETMYGFTRDTGHFFGMRAASAFTAQLRIRARYTHLYDQAGIMVRVDEARWVKAGIEFSDGRAMLGSVLTDRKSDWATSAYAGDPGDFWMRATVADGVLRLQISPDGVTWPILRLAPFPVTESYRVGPMACSPERSGLDVVFSELQIMPALRRDLHDLT